MPRIKKLEKGAKEIRKQSGRKKGSFFRKSIKSRSPSQVPWNRAYFSGPEKGGKISSGAENREKPESRKKQVRKGREIRKRLRKGVSSNGRCNNKFKLSYISLIYIYVSVCVVSISMCFVCVLICLTFVLICFMLFVRYLLDPCPWDRAWPWPLHDFVDWVRARAPPNHA